MTDPDMGVVAASQTGQEYEIIYLNGFSEIVPDVETARKRIVDPSSRPPEAPQDQIATYRVKMTVD